MISMLPIRRKGRKTIQKGDLRGLQLSNLGLSDFRIQAAQFPDAEFLYLRENEFTRFDPGIMLVHLRVLDLCQNHIVNVDFLRLLPQLRHLYLTGNRIESFEGFHDLEELETLCVSNNRIPSFEGLGMLPNLRILSVNNNLISDFKFFPFLPSLYALNLLGNPLTSNELHRKLAIAVCNHELCKIDGQEVTNFELEDTRLYRGKVAFCITEGFMAKESGFSVAEQADVFLLTKQRETTRQHSLVLQHIHLASNLREGNPVTLQVCLQDRRPLLERKLTKFQSNQIYPVELTVQGEAQQVLLVGSMNNWREPLELERCTENGNVFFHTTLYLPPGEYEYRYIVDGEEKVSEHTKTISKFNETICNVYKVTGVAEDLDPNSSTLLHIRWLRSNVNSGFDLIEGENSLVHVPGLEDVGACLRAEVLSYLNGQFEALVFDITPPIMCGLPMCTRMELQGDPVESGELTVQWAYSGGQESGSTFQWTRISPQGQETILPVGGPVYQVTVADVGSKLKVVYTPMRDDNVRGDPRIVFSPTIVPAPPVAKGFSMVGSFVEGEPILLETEYYGGREGHSRYQWYRQRNGGYDPIQGATGRTYTPTSEDVGQILTAEYVPVCDDGRQGDAVRTDSSPIASGRPKATVQLYSDFQNGYAIGLEATYSGGDPGEPVIQWFRTDESGRSAFFVPTSPQLHVVQPSDHACIIGVQYTPVRDDGLRGETLTVQYPHMIGSVLPQQLKIKPDVLVEGCIAEVNADNVGRIEWHVSDEKGDGFVIMPMATNCRSIVLSAAEVYRKLKVIYKPMQDGKEGTPISVESGFVEPAPPKAVGVDMVAHNQGYRGTFTYSGGRAGDHAHRWIRVTPQGTEVTVDEMRGPGSIYTPVEADVGCRLRYAVCPCRVDGVQGQWAVSGLSAVIQPTEPAVPDMPPVGSISDSAPLAPMKPPSSVSSFSSTTLPQSSKNMYGAWGIPTPASTTAPSLPTSSWRVPVTPAAGMGAWGMR